MTAGGARNRDGEDPGPDGPEGEDPGPDGSDGEDPAAERPDGEFTRGGSAAPDQRRRLSIPLETLAVLNWLGDIGVDGVEDRLSHVEADGLTVQTEQVKIGYTEKESVSAQFGSEEHVGVWVRIANVFGGHVLVLFPLESGERAAALMVRSVVEDVSSVSTEMGRDALTELGNMMANGFVDQWATVFDTPIDTRSPIHVQNPESTLVRHNLNRDDLGLYITSRFRIPDHDIDGAVYLFPGDEEFVTKISQVGLEVVYQ